MKNEKKNPMDELPPKQLLRRVAREFPDAWAQMKKMREGRGKDLPDWPDWCYAPIAAGIAIATHGDSSHIHSAMFSALSPAIITAAAAWRVSQGIYRFDADLYNALVQQPLDGNIPSETLTHLPEWCVYIETIGASFLAEPIVGFWAHLESDANDGRMELRFVFMHKKGSCVSAALHLGAWTIEEGVARMHEESVKQAALSELAEFLPVSEHLKEMFSSIQTDMSTDIAPFIQLVLYVCAENSDMHEKPRHPSTRIKTFGGINAPKEPRVWQVGERIGSTIRQYRNLEAQGQVEPQGGTHASPRPHVRRAHWHHFRAGQGRKELVLRWLPPMPIGIEDDSNPVVIRTLENTKREEGEES